MKDVSRVAFVDFIRLMLNLVINVIRCVKDAQEINLIAHHVITLLRKKCYKLILETKEIELLHVVPVYKIVQQDFSLIL